MRWRCCHTTDGINPKFKNGKTLLPLFLVGLNQLITFGLLCILSLLWNGSKLLNFIEFETMNYWYCINHYTPHPNNAITCMLCSDTKNILFDNLHWKKINGPIVGLTYVVVQSCAIKNCRNVFQQYSHSNYLWWQWKMNDAMKRCVM